MVNVDLERLECIVPDNFFSVIDSGRGPEVDPCIATNDGVELVAIVLSCVIPLVIQLILPPCLSLLEYALFLLLLL